MLRSLHQRELGAAAHVPAGAPSLSAALEACFASAARFEVFSSSPGCVTALELEPVAGRLLLSTDTRATVRLFDGQARVCGGAAGACPAQLASYFDAARAHSRAVTSCAWYPRDGGLFVTGGADGLCVVWDPGVASGAGGTLAPVFRVPVGGSSSSGPSPGKVNCVAMSPCASSHALVACGTDSPSLPLFDLTSGSAVHALPGHREGVLACAWAPLHEHLLASGARDGALLLHDVRRSGRLALLAAAEATATEQAWAASALAPGAAGRLAALRLPAPVRESLGLAFRGGALGSDTAVLGNPTGDVAGLSAKAHGVGGVNGLLWLPPQQQGQQRSHAHAQLLSTGGDGRALLWGVGLVGEEGSSSEWDAGNLVDGRACGVGLWNSLKELSGVRNRARRCVRLAASGGVGSGAQGVLFHPLLGGREGGAPGAAAPAPGAGAGVRGGSIGMWDARSGAALGSLSGGHVENVNAVCWSGAGGGALFSGGDDGLILRWRVPVDAPSALDEDTEEEAEEEEVMGTQ